jgi:hypothetical protein
VIIRLDLADSRLLKEPGDRRKQAASLFGWAFSSESCARLDDEGAWVGLLRRDFIWVRTQSRGPAKKAVVCEAKVMFPRSCLEFEGTRDANVILFDLQTNQRKTPTMRELIVFFVYLFGIYFLRFKQETYQAQLSWGVK